MPPIRVLVVDDHALVREGLIRLLEQVPTLLPVGQAANGLEAVECARESQPDAALIDLWLPELDGLETTRRLLEVCPQLRILLLGEAESEEIALRALRIGAFGYVLKTQPFGAVARAIEVAMDGSVTLPRDVAYRALVRERVPTSHDSDRASHAAASLTEREWQILNGIAAGESNRRIAIRLVISEHTVRAHVRNLMKKLGVGTRAQAAAVAAGYLGDEVGARNGGTIP